MKESAAGNRTIEILGSLASWLVPLFVYAYTLAPCVTAGDAGDFVVAVHRFSLPHSPGYPLYMLLAKIWTIIPLNLGSDPFAVKMNLFSMIAIVVACSVFYRLARSLTGSVGAALGATLILAFSRTFWKFSVVTEAYGLNLLLILLVLWGLASAREGKRSGLLMSSVAFGLGLAHHHSILLLLPAIILLWPRGKGAVKISPALIVAGIVLPLLLYLLIPVMAARTPQYMETGFSSRDFTDTVTRAEYTQRPAYQSLDESQLVGPVDVFDRATRYLPKQIGWILLILSVAGFFFAPAGKRIWGFTIILTAVIWIFGVTFLTRGSPLGMPFNFLRSVDEFLLPVNIFLALGFAWLLGSIAKILVVRRDFEGTEGLNIIPAEYISLTIALLMCVPAVFLGMVNLKYCDMTQHTFMQDQTRNILQQVPENGVLIVSGDESYMFEYLQEVRGIGDDVELLIYPFARLVPAGGGRSIVLPPQNALAYFIDQELGDRACVFSFSPPAAMLPLLEVPRALRLEGVAQVLVEREAGMDEFFHTDDPNVWMTYQLRNLDPPTLGNIDPPSHGNIIIDDFEFETLSRYAEGARVTSGWLGNNGYPRQYVMPFLGLAKTIETALSFTDYPAPPLLVQEQPDEPEEPESGEVDESDDELPVEEES